MGIKGSPKIGDISKMIRIRSKNSVIILKNGLTSNHRGEFNGAGEGSIEEAGIIWSMTITEVITSVTGLILFGLHYRRLENPKPSDLLAKLLVIQLKGMTS
ncbi:hypothetical protein D3C76_1604930 [compost metagenome]